jgi:hypothetical protein
MFGKRKTAVSGNDVVVGALVAAAYTQDGGFKKMAKTVAINRSTLSTSSFPLTGTLTASLATANQYDTRIPYEMLGNIESIHLMLKISGSAGAAVPCTPIASMIDRLEFLGRAGGQLLTTLRGETMNLTEALMLDADEFALYAAQNNWPKVTTHANAQQSTTCFEQTVAGQDVDATSKYFLIPLRSFIFEGLPDEKIVGRALTKGTDLVIRLYTKASPNFSGAALTLSDHQIIVTEMTMKPEEVAIYEGLYSVPLKHYFSEILPQTFTSQVLVSGTQVRLQQTQLVGRCFGIIVVARASVALASGAHTQLTRLDTTSASSTWDLQESSGRSLLGPSEQNGQYLSTAVWSSLDVPNHRIAIQPISGEPVGIYALMFGTSISDALHSRASSGGLVLNGDQWLVFTPKVSATLHITVYGLMRRSLVIDKNDIVAVNMSESD